MTIQTINIGGYANDGTGDDLRTAFTKVNNNFAQLGSTVGIQNGANLGVGASIFAQRNNTTANLEFKTLTSTDNSVTITHTTDSVNLAASPNIINDTTPSLGGDLLLNGHIINGQNGTGDVKSTVFNLDVRAMSGMLQVLLQNTPADFGPFVSPAGTTISVPVVDMGSFLIPTTNTFDFGTL